MAKRLRKRDMEAEMLETIFTLEERWKYLQAIMDKSVEPNGEAMFELELAKAKYLFLLREARLENVNAIQYIP